MSDSLDWSPLRPFGAKVRLDLCGDPGEARIAQLRDLFDCHRLLVFSGQSLSHRDQLRVCGWFGPVAPEKPASFYTTDSAMGALGSGELAFHSDLSCTPEPLLGISLHAIDVDERASATMFVDAIAAARQLPARLRARLKGLEVMNLWPASLSGQQRYQTVRADWPGTAHPVLKPHPRTGQPMLYLNASHSSRIVGLADDESESLIGELFERLYDPASRYDHRWRNGDFLVWDNLALQHARCEVPPGISRTLQRVEIGTCSYMNLMPPELLAAYGLQ